MVYFNFCYVLLFCSLVKNIWNDLVSDPETTSQLVTLAQTILQNERTYRAVRDMLLQLLTDEQKFRELPKLVDQ